MAKQREACGRCSASVAVEVANDGRDDDERTERDPFAEERIEVDEGAIRRLTPDGWIAGVSRRLDALVQRLTWGR